MRCSWGGGAGGLVAGWGGCGPDHTRCGILHLDSTLEGRISVPMLGVNSTSRCRCEQMLDCPMHPDARCKQIAGILHLDAAS